MVSSIDFLFCFVLPIASVSKWLLPYFRSCRQFSFPWNTITESCLEKGYLSEAKIKAGVLMTLFFQKKLVTECDRIIAFDESHGFQLLESKLHYPRSNHVSFRIQWRILYWNWVIFVTHFILNAFNTYFYFSNIMVFYFSVNILDPILELQNNNNTNRFQIEP